MQQNVTLSLFEGNVGRAAEVPSGQWLQALQKPGKEGTWTKRLMALQILSKRAEFAVQETEQTHVCSARVITNICKP